ncbi:SDR family NAD(P)-dependent oxidoreductase [Sphingobium sp. CR2-8]|uniref:SDR family NAD(P)-dependent oxidoreductase n=1 Tax=Sphingobium sp. CR2-8 TaxID=1306534 RepID=UPI002DBCB7A3|nr:SDR family NAD(P)-dependent oxidoreductase [Sphingobium sp. CR2-8]MEC3911903.1 SDR family NAD(P)-dependent oxidoreductase [Sphingobium sp. CR2-8]
MPSKSPRFVAIVTGAAQGIGAATVRQLVTHGYYVSLVDRNPEALQQAARDLPQDLVHTIVADVSSAADMQRMADETIDRFGAIDALHANAAINGAGGPTRFADPGDFDLVMGVNVRGAMITMQAVLPTMLAQGRGSIVFTASAAGLRASPQLGVYSVSKFALIGLMKNAAADLGPAGIRVNAVAPGLTDTPAYRRVVQQGKASGERNIFEKRTLPLGRIGEADEVAEAVHWLLSDAARYVTGAVLSVDGGLIL